VILHNYGRCVDRSNSINIEEFILTLLGDLNNYRLNIIRQAFTALDVDKSGHLDLNEVKSIFNPTRHPDVVSGTRSVEDVRQEFFDMFTTHHNISGAFE
jgi:hypothetical protein